MFGSRHASALEALAVQGVDRLILEMLGCTGSSRLYELTLQIESGSIVLEIRVKSET